MGREGYQHIAPAQPPPPPPPPPAAHHHGGISEPGSTSAAAASPASDGGWAARLLPHLSAPVPPPHGDEGAPRTSSLPNWMRLPLQQSEPGGSVGGVGATTATPDNINQDHGASHVVPYKGPHHRRTASGGAQALAEGLRTASHTLRHPHEAAVEVAGRMQGKNYGHD